MQGLGCVVIENLEIIYPKHHLSGALKMTLMVQSLIGSGSVNLTADDCHARIRASAIVIRARTDWIELGVA
jgi:hypothetical protein